MNIYFAASIRGGRDDQEIYKQIIELLRSFGTVLTEHFGNKDIVASAGTGKDVVAIYKQDMDWVTMADVVVAEVTQPSLGVGYEIGRAEDMGKKILCLYRETPGRSLSAMIAGNEKLNVKTYISIAEVRNIFEEFFA
ncbi:MAG TPA: nucleoside 2-deoxyribosyltransferase [Candidatus Andersenbacteria bacterium]|nr:nucleoside 2-deoxyribosyltransferase [Candidatus Andersenbacteria bacterium]